MIENNFDFDIFKKTVWDFYYEHYRVMPWRTETNPYFVMISEIMLQQTQVQRVILKFTEFINRFPNIEALANASLSDVLETWIGLGYNRRAKFLKQSAEIIVFKKNGEFPSTIEEWIELPGFGKNTAGAVMVYSKNTPLVFIETNIRTVYIFHFYKDKNSVTDSEIETIAKATLDINNPREWYWALMDYGTYLKKEFGNLSRKSSSYTVQSKFNGSFRQKRAMVLKEIVNRKIVSIDELHLVTKYNSDILKDIIQKLLEENFISGQNNQFWII